MDHTGCRHADVKVTHLLKEYLVKCVSIYFGSNKTDISAKQRTLHTAHLYLTYKTLKIESVIFLLFFVIHPFFLLILLQLLLENTKVLLSQPRYIMPLLSWVSSGHPHLCWSHLEPRHQHPGKEGPAVAAPPPQEVQQLKNRLDSNLKQNIIDTF